MTRQSLAAVILVGLSAAAGRGDVKAPDPIPQRVARSALVFVGKVKAIEEKPVELDPYPGADAKAAYKVAVVTIDDPLLGAAGSKTVRVAFTAPSPRRGFTHLNFQPGQEALFFLTRYHGQPTYRVASYEDVVNKKDNPGFADLLATTKRCAKLLDDPNKGLTAKNKDDRYLTAAMLLLRYRTVPMASPKSRREEEVPLGQSKKLLQALADANWDARRAEFGHLTPPSIFVRLGASEKDGWKTPQDFRQYAPAAKQWLTENAGKFRLKRWAVERKKDDPEPDR